MELEHSNQVKKESIQLKDKPSIGRLKELREIITELDVCEQVEILKILEKNKVKYTSNNNGIFINMNKLSSEILDELDTFIKFVKNNYKKLI